MGKSITSSPFMTDSRDIEMDETSPYKSKFTVLKFSGCKTDSGKRMQSELTQYGSASKSTTSAEKQSLEKYRSGQKDFDVGSINLFASGKFDEVDNGFLPDN